MDFMNRNAQPQAANSSSPAAPTTPLSSSKPEKTGRTRRLSDNDKLWRLATVILLFSMTILGIAIIGILALGGGTDQRELIKTNRYQAVFLTNGQVYFGKIVDLNKSFFRLDNIYYLTQNTTTDSKGQATTDGNYTLVKLGCQQIHDPYDEMVISHDQVTFWENLQNNGKVATSIAAFQKANPNGPDCSQVSNQTQASSNTGTQGTNNTSGTTPTGTTNPATKQ